MDNAVPLPKLYFLKKQFSLCGSGRRLKWIVLLPSVIIVSLLFFLMYSLPAQALMLQFSMADLSLGADTIVVGTVNSLSSQWDTDHKRINTSVVVSVEESLKGAAAAGSRITVTIPGGTIEGITERVSDTPIFKAGEKTFLFLKQGAQGNFTVYGYSQGKYDVVQGMVAKQSLATFKEQVFQIINGKALESSTGGWAAAEPVKLTDYKTAVSKITVASIPAAIEGWQTVISENFENTFPGTAWGLNGNPTWGRTTYNAYAGTYSGWCARGGASGTDPAANPAGYSYSNAMNAWMIYGPFSLSGATSAELSFQSWIKTEAGVDILAVLASINGVNFNGYTISGQYPAWANAAPANFNFGDWPGLGNLYGQPSVYLAFLFNSNTSITDKGVFLDDILLRKFIPPANMPQITGITPASASAGTDSQVNINGSYFGSTAGSVNFFYKQGQPEIQGEIVTWSDTSITLRVPVAIINEYPASASSGPVKVIRSAGAESAAYPFTVTFSYMGYKWPGESPVVNLYINPNTTDCEGEETAVKNAANSWSNVLDQSFNFNYAGPSAAISAGLNGSNEMLWRNLGDTGVIAHAVSWGSGGTFGETDIEFNEYFTWSTATTAPVDKMDVETIALHELGHWLSLRDLYGNLAGYPQDTAKIMYGFCGNGITKRTLDATDVAGIQWIYPVLAVPPTVTTSAATNIGANAATLNSTLNTKGSASSVALSFEYWQGGPDVTTGHNTVAATPATGTADSTPFTYYLAGLLASTQYSFRAIADGDGDPVKGSISSFATPADAVTRSLPTNVARGQTFNVTVAFIAPANDFNTAGLADFIPAGWTVTALNALSTPNSNNAVATANKAELTWYGPYTSSTVFTAVYQVTVPAEAALSTHNFTNGSLVYQIGSGGQTNITVTGASQVTVVEGARLQGSTWQANGTILGGVTVTLDGAASVVSGDDGNYQIITATLVDHTLVAANTGYRNQTQTVNVTDLAAVYTIDFKGNNALVPNGATMAYALQCINKWKFPPADGTGLSMSKALTAINAWKFPIP